MSLVAASSGMSVRRIAVVIALLFLPANAWPGSVVLQKLISENCRIASTIVRGNVLSFEDAYDVYTRTTLRVTQSIRGDVKPGSIITYYSAREAGYTANTLVSDIIVFLIKTRIHKTESFGTAVDFSEYSASDINAYLNQCEGRSHK